MPETKAWMKFLWVQTPSRYRCSARSGNAGIQTHVSLKTSLQSASCQKTTHTDLPLLVQLFFLLCSVWMVCCCRRASCSGVTSLQSAELRRTDSTQRRVLLAAQYRYRPQGSPPATSFHIVAAHTVYEVLISMQSLTLFYKEAVRRMNWNFRICFVILLTKQQTVKNFII